MGRQIRIIPGFRGKHDEYLCFRTEPSPREGYEPNLITDIPLGPGAIYKTALEVFYEQLLLGKEFPPVLILTQTGDIQEIMAAALYVAPDLALESQCSSLIYACSLWSRWGGPVASSHMETEHYETIEGALKEVSSSRDRYQGLVQAITVIETYLRTGITEILDLDSEIEILKESYPFIVFGGAPEEVKKVGTWRQIYQKGYLCGVWVQEEKGQIIILKKSSLVEAFDSRKVCALLNEKEYGQKQVPQGTGWHLAPDKNLILPPQINSLTAMPSEGTELKWEEVLEILLEET